MSGESGEVPPRCTVVTAVFNRAELLPRAIESVLAQTMRDFELVIVDDGSTDGSAEVAASYDDPRVRIIRQQNSGAGSARNHGVSEGSGRWITFLDSDDEVVTRWLEQLLAHADAEAGVVSCGTINVSESGVRALRAPQPMTPFYPDITAACWFSGSYLVRRDVFDAVGGFTPGLRSSQHSDLGLRLAKRSMEMSFAFRSFDDPLLCRYEGSPLSIRRNWRALYEGSVQMMELHADLYARDRRQRAKSQLIAGTRAAKLGEFSRSRRHFWAAWRDRPVALKPLAGMVATSIPPVARRVFSVKP